MTHTQWNRIGIASNQKGKKTMYKNENRKQSRTNTKEGTGKTIIRRGKQTKKEKVESKAGHIQKIG